MSTFGADLIQSLTEAVAHAKGEGRAIVHAPVTPREVRKRALVGCLLMGFARSPWAVRGSSRWATGRTQAQLPAHAAQCGQPGIPVCREGLVQGLAAGSLTTVLFRSAR